jgi:wyosine [tRNA(Phe)-imidazoG37] synthetase (radical SAM superfamily)
VRSEFGMPEVKLILITNSTCLDRPNVQEGLRLLQKGSHEVWAKLDAGTPEYFRLVNRTSISLERILKNITETSKWMPLTIQSLFARVRGEPPSDAEIAAYCDRIREIFAAGGKIEKLQLYTIARPTPEKWITALSKSELDHIAALIKAGVPSCPTRAIALDP